MPGGLIPGGPREGKFWSPSKPLFLAEFSGEGKSVLGQLEKRRRSFHRMSGRGGERSEH